jgi:hypothetical protein
MNWIVGWLEDESCPGPVLRQPPRRQKLHLLLWLILLGFIASLLTSAALTFVFVWITRGIHWQDWQLWLRSTWLTAMWLIGGSIIVVSVSSLARRIYEWHRWGPQK